LTLRQDIPEFGNNFSNNYLLIAIMSRKRQYTQEEVNIGQSKRLRRDTNTPRILEQSVVDRVEEKKKIEIAWRKSKTTKEVNFKTEIEQIKKETHPVIQVHVEKLKKVREHKFRLLEEWKENQFLMIEESLEAGRKECNDEYEKNVKEIKDQLLGLANQDRKLIEAKKSSANRKSQRVRSNILRNKGFFHTNDGSTSIVMQIQVLSRLSDKELREEMAAIQKAIKEHEG